MEDLSNNQVNKNNKEGIIMNDNKEFIREYIRYGEEMTEEEFIKEQEETMKEVEEYNRQIREEELEREIERVGQEIREMEQERISALAEMEEYNSKLDNQ